MNELVKDAEENWIWPYWVVLGREIQTYFLGNKNNPLCLLSLMDQDGHLALKDNNRFVYTKAYSKPLDLPSAQKHWSLSYLLFASSFTIPYPPACAVNFMAVAYASKKPFMLS